MKITVAKSNDIEFIANVCRDVKELYDPIMLGAFERQAKRYEENGLPTNYQIDS